METKLANKRFQRIAQDLEKLPCELQGDILDDLEFSQLIRLSSCAGPRLTWSLQNSLSTWSKYFHTEKKSTWQKLLSLTDRIRYLCYGTPETKGDLPDIFKYHGLSFLSYHNSDWHSEKRAYGIWNPACLGREEGALATHWLSELDAIVVTATWDTFHEHYSRLVKPLLPKLPPQSSHVFSKIPDLGCEDATWFQAKCRPYRPIFSADELASFIDIYQQYRLVRAEALAAELFRLADIYDAHPTRLKQPYDPRTRAPEEFNARHVPMGLRREGHNRIKRAKTTPWASREIGLRRFAWPPLVPWETEVQFFNDCLESVAGEQGVGGQQRASVETRERCRAVVDKAPSWAREDTEIEVDAVAHLSKALDKQHLSSHGLTLKTRLRAYPIDWSKREPAVWPVLPRGDAELEWLKSFAEVTALLEAGPWHGLRSAR